MAHISRQHSVNTRTTKIFLSPTLSEISAWKIILGYKRIRKTPGALHIFSDHLQKFQPAFVTTCTLALGF
jgi:hypothetical protein